MKRAKDEQTPSDEDKYEKYSLYKSDKASPGGQIPPPSSAMTSQVESVYFVNYRAVVVKTKRYYVTQNSYMLFGDVFKIYNLKGEIKKIHAFFPGDENNLSDTLIMLKTTVVAVTTSKAEALRVADGIEMTCKICRKKRKATKFSIEGFLRKVRCDTCRVKPKNLINKMRRVNNVKGEQQTFLAVSSNTTNDSSCTPSAAAAMATSVNPSRTGRKSAPLCNDAADEIIAMIIELIKYISWMQKALMRASKGNYVIDHTEINIEKISKVVHSAQVLCNKLLRQKSLVDQTGSNSRNFTNFIPMYNTNSNNLRMKYANLYENKMSAIHSRPIETNLANSNAVNVFNNIINHNTLSLSNCAAAQRNVSATPSCSSGGSGGSSGSAGNSGGSGGNRTGNDSASNSTSGEGAPNESGPNGTSPTNISNLTSVTNLTNAPSNGSNSNATMETDSPLNNFSTINNRNILPYYSNACQITCVPPSPCSTRNDSRMNHFIKQENNYMYRNKQTEEFPNMQSNNKNSYYTDKQDIVFSALSKQYNSNVNISFNNINNSVSNFYRTVSKNYNIRDTILNLDK
ncbi:hypothetical protein PVMG_03580 [Plasmodium vivax Mauritania I]|uniref:Uncharacterized protein n=1 Tax=Plasmodium vivax Mauritania I TaxID=1035515 RepID=A0A0J9T4H4_PLAVI|nr:hypothetical protein PVMG_03580 [Plasmodium vivax Mauritania I]